ncbi:hypothetical protein ABT061_15560 [Streptosporangium sp. NPDC002544]|uniref:hypothetical protein n=1 Tax=Streptosporangium sp. NPDC002544 TaxID=3154538 RepID=UPI00332715E6
MGSARRFSPLRHRFVEEGGDSPGRGDQCLRPDPWSSKTRRPGTPDDAARRQVYAALESVFGLKGHIGTITVTPVTDGDGAFGEWTGVFEAEASIVTLRDSVYLPGLRGLRKRLEG